MKKRLGLLLSSYVIFSLISCNTPQEQSKQESSKEDSNNPTLISSEIDPSTSLSVEVYYRVTFVNYDESVLYEVDVLEGNEATYSGEDPVKEEDDEFTYEFDGWDKELTNIQSDTTFVAQYKAVAKENWGPITWFN